MPLTHKNRKKFKRLVTPQNFDLLCREYKITKDEGLKLLKGYLSKKDYNTFLDNLPKVISENPESNLPFIQNFYSLLKQNKLLLIFLSIFSFLLYFNTLDNGFVSDDIYTIVNNPDLGKFSHVFNDPLYFAYPLVHYVIFTIFKYSATAFRFWNILLHTLSALTLFLILLKIFNKRVAVLASLIFIVHPILVESVSWISGYTHVQYTFFFLLSFYLYLFSNKNDKIYWWSLVFLFISMSSSQKAIVLPLFYPLYDYLFTRKLKEFKHYMPHLVLLLVWGLYTVSGVGARLENLETQHYTERVFINPFILIPTAISNYLQLIFYPNILTIYHTELFMDNFELILRILVTIVFFSLFIYFYFKNKKILFWFLLFFISLSPTLTPFGISWIVAERYVYLGSIGIFVTISLLLDFLISKFPGSRNFIYFMFFILILALATRTTIRNNEWQNEDTLWIATVKTSPSSHNAHNNMGDVYARHGNYEKAIEEFEMATKIKPNYADAYHNLGVTYSIMNDLENARKSYLEAVEINPNLWQSYQNLALLEYNSKNFAEAKLYINKSIEIVGDANLYTILGAIEYDSGNIQEAQKIFELVLNNNPLNTTASEYLSKIKLLNSGNE